MERAGAIPPEVLSVIRDMSDAARQQSPSDWADLDLSQDGIDRTINEGLRKEFDEVQAVIDLIPSGQAAASIIGGMAGSIFSLKDAPWLFIGGGGGSLFRVAGREALINAAQETTVLPAQFEMAERLDIPEPDIATQLALATAGGAAFGAGLEAAARGVRYFRARRQATEMRDALGRLRDDIEAQMMMDEAESVLSDGGVDAMERLAEIPERLPERPPYLLENPINPERPPLILEQSQRVGVGAEYETSGTFSLLHGYSGKPQAEFDIDYAGPRYPEGNVYGDDVIYLDADGKWTANDPMKMMFEVEQVARVSVTFDKALRVTPETISDVAAMMGRTGQVLDPKDIVAAAKENGYDGVIIEGWDKFERDITGPPPADWMEDNPEFGAKLKEAQDQIEHLGMDPDAAQDQVLALNPRSLKVEEDNLPPGTPLKSTPDFTAPQGRITTTPLDEGQREPLSDANLMETLRAGIEEAEAEAATLQPKSRRLPGFFRGQSGADGQFGEKAGIDPNGPAGRELKAILGTNNLNRLAPGTFRRGGRQDVDNLVASEMEEMFPGITEAAGLAPDGNYLDRQGVLDVLARDLQGDTSWLRAAQDAERLRGQAAEIEQAIEAGTWGAADDIQARTRAESGTFIDLNDYQFDQDWMEANDQIAAKVSEYIDSTGIRFTDAERAEIIDLAQKNGGDVEYMVEQMATREIDFAVAKEAEADEIPFPDRAQGDGESPQAGADAEGAGRAGQPERPTGGEGGGGARDGDADGPQQAVIPGADRVETGQAQRDRATIAARQQQSRMGRLDQERVEDDANSLFGTRTRDMFDDVTSPEARTVQDVVETDIRDSVEAGENFQTAIEMPDGTFRTVSASDGLDLLDEIEAFSARIDLCGMRGS
jgi:hypothetical protein